jgi:hypothetical protein
MREDQVSRNPILESFTFNNGNPMIFRVSRACLDSINRLVNTEKYTHDFGEEFTTFKEAIFRVYSFTFILLYKDD